MRILVITNRFPRPGHETDATYNGFQVDALAEGNEVRAIVPVPWPERLRDMRRGGAGTRSTRGTVKIYHPTFWFLPRVGERWVGQAYLQCIRRALGEPLRGFQPDVIYSCWAHPDGWAAVEVGRQLGIPVVIKVIGSDVLVLGRNPRRRAGVADALKRADGVIAVSEDLARHVRELGVEAARVHVISEGTNTQAFGPGDQAAAAGRLGLGTIEPGSFRLLFVGNLLMSKGAGVLVEACQILKKDGVRFECLFVGRGRDEEKLRAAASELGGMVKFAGSCPSEKLPDWYRASDVVALPSYSEGIPNVLREAMMCGRRFVATRVGGIPEITRPGVGTLVEAGDAKALAVAIVTVVNAGTTTMWEAAVLNASAELNISWQRSAMLVEQVLSRAATK